MRKKTKTKTNSVPSEDGKSDGQIEAELFGALEEIPHYDVSGCLVGGGASDDEHMNSSKTKVE
jgi:hypothetical protein